MATRKRTARALLEPAEPPPEVRGLLEPGHDDASLRELVGRLGRDTGDLVRGEIALAKLELKESATGVAKDAGALAVAGFLAAAGVLALLACIILVLGNLLDAYWAGALIVGVALLVIAGITTWLALRRMREREIAPTETIRTIREDTAWAAGEAREFKQEVMGGGKE